VSIPAPPAIFKVMLNKLQIFGMLVGILAIGLGVYWFDWKLSLVIFLAIYGNNLERSSRKKS